jgi:hypothetical protein
MGTHTCQQPAAVLPFLLARLFTKNSQKAQPEREVSMPLQLLTVIVLDLMCGSGMNIEVFGHPTLNKQPLEVHIPVRASFAKLFGRVMPFWMGASTLLNLLLLLPFGHSNRFVWRTDAIALTIQLTAVGFSLIGPVPIKNRIARWALASLPSGLAYTGASLGRLPLAQNIRANHGVRVARARACRALAPLGGSAESLLSMIPFIVQ